MARQQRNKYRSGRAALIAVTSVAAVVAIFFLLMSTLFMVRRTDVEGCVNSNPKAVMEAASSGKYSKNSLCLYFKNKLDPVSGVPFVESVKVKLASPWHVTLKVTEKSLIGYVYDESAGTYSYIDTSGRIAEQTQSGIDGLVQITGVTMGDAKAGDVLPAEPSSTGAYLASLCKYAQKYSLDLSRLQVGENGSVTMVCGKISIIMGLDNKTEAKFSRLQIILPKLEGKSGTIDLSGWEDDSDDIIFSESASGDASGDVAS